MTSASIRSPTARSTAAANAPKKTRCPSKKAATCSSSPQPSARPKATPTSPSTTGRCFTKWADYLLEEGPRPRKPALHRRLRRPPRPQRQPLHQGHRRASAPTPRWPAPSARPPKPTQYASRRQADGRQVADDGQRRRPLQARLRQARHLEPEVQPGLGQAPWPNLFPAKVKQHRTRLLSQAPQPYGLPLDSRADYTKLDWQIWTATLADNSQPVRGPAGAHFAWVNETPTRVPLTDWYDTKNGKQIGFQARSVVGGHVHQGAGQSGNGQEMAATRTLTMN